MQEEKLFLDRSLIMKHLFEEPPNSEYSNDMSSIREFSVDQEVGAHTILKNDEASMEDPTVCSCFPCRKYLNPTRVFFAEMVGTFILMFCVCGIIAITQLKRGEVGLLEYAFTGGLSIIVVVFSIGSISGAHVNPAITIAFATLGQFPWSKVPLYILAQMMGSVLATYVGKSVYNIQADLIITQPLHRRKEAFWAEFIATFIIMFLAASLSSKGHAVYHLSGFVFGAAIMLAVLVTGPVSGGSLNPARSFGPAIVSWRFDNIWLYLTAPTIGAIAGALLFQLLHIQREHLHPLPLKDVNSTSD